MPNENPVFLTLQCPSCGGKSSFSSNSNRFVCQYCGNEHIFHLPAQRADAVLALKGGVDRALRARLRPVSPRPGKVRLKKDDQSLRLSWRWFSSKFLFLIFFCIAWDSFLVFWYGAALAMPGTPWIMIVFPIVHLAVGIGLTYYTLAGIFNTTTVNVDRNTFSVQHDPFPWSGEIKVPVERLSQFYCKEKRVSTENGNQYSYQLSAVLKNGQEYPLVSNLESPDLAAFLEQQIESWLHIDDVEVAGEIG